MSEDLEFEDMQFVNVPSNSSTSGPWTFIGPISARERERKWRLHALAYSMGESSQSQPSSASSAEKPIAAGAWMEPMAPIAGPAAA